MKQLDSSDHHIHTMVVQNSGPYRSIETAIAQKLRAYKHLDRRPFLMAMLALGYFGLCAEHTVRVPTPQGHAEAFCVGHADISEARRWSGATCDK
jgi:hypothetical protein